MSRKRKHLKAQATPPAANGAALPGHIDAALSASRYKEAIEHYKLLLKRERRPAWVEGLAAAYAGRAAQLAAKGLVKEALALWRTRAEMCGAPLFEGPYVSCSQNIEAFFSELKNFARALTAEEQRGVAEGLTEEELALFDILTKPEPALAKAEEAAVNRACRELLATLKREKLVLDWREKQQARAAVMQTLKQEIRVLPAAYTKDIRVEKLARAYAHVYDHYFGAGQSAYQGARVA
jgi:hypothetical protein